MLGMQMVISDAALKDSSVRNFPVSKNRSKRIEKKLIKKHGGVWKKIPAIWRVGDKLIVHPSLVEQIQEATSLVRKDAYENQVFGILTNR